jgi:sporulation protein YlmC with PRC-barrel domain
MANQDTSTKSGNGDITAGPSTKKGPGPELMSAKTLVGNDVYNKQGDDIGDIKDIMLDMRDGRVSYAVLTFTAFLSTGAKLFAVPWSALTLDTKNKRFVLDVAKDRLKDAPGFDKSHWPDMADQTWQNEIHGYYKAVHRSVQ